MANSHASHVFPREGQPAIQRLTCLCFTHLSVPSTLTHKPRIRTRTYIVCLSLAVRLTITTCMDWARFNSLLSSLSLSIPRTSFVFYQISDSWTSRISGAIYPDPLDLSLERSHQAGSPSGANAGSVEKHSSLSSRSPVPMYFCQ